MKTDQHFRDIMDHSLRAIVAELVDERLKEATPQRTIISVKQASERYDIHKTTIYDWFAQGIIRKHTIGGRVFCFIEDFETIKKRARK